jgi:uncharacterized membrane protein
MFIKLYLIALPIFFIIDMIWLLVVSKNYYAEQIGRLMKTNVNWPAALIFYLLFIAGLVLFVILPAVAMKSWSHALIYGAFLGLIAYATYDLSNLAVLKEWPLTITIVDMIWGMTISGSVATLTYLVSTKI